MLRVDLSTGDFVLAPATYSWRPDRPIGAPTPKARPISSARDSTSATTCDGPFYRGAKDLTVVGGGNSGLEEGLFLTEFADHVTVVQAMSKLTANKLLQEKVLEPSQDVGVLLDTLGSRRSTRMPRANWNRSRCRAMGRRRSTRPPVRSSSSDSIPTRVSSRTPSTSTNEVSSSPTRTFERASTVSSLLVTCARDRRNRSRRPWAKAPR